MTKNIGKNNYQAWLKRLNQEDLPIFGRTVQEIVSVAENQDSSVPELTRVVLQDTTMTAKVLKLANTAYYNPSNKSISTISRAIMLMGFEKVRAITLTVALVESVVRSSNRKSLMRELARSLHAATQAQALAEKMGDQSSEEIFVATLLHNVGELAFWCFAKEEGETLNRELIKGTPKEEAEIKVLGFPLQKLTRRLVKEWQLNPLLEETLKPGKKKDRRSRMITLCHELAIAAEKGWLSDEVTGQLRDIGMIIGISVDKVMDIVQGNARAAANVSKSYGVEQVASIIPSPLKVIEEEDKIREAPVEGEVPEESENREIFQYNPVLQLSILRDMSSLLFEKPDFNLLLQMTLEGIYRGIGMDRTLFALITPDRQYLKARYALGQQRESMLEKFQFKLTLSRLHIYKYVLDNVEGIWGGNARHPQGITVSQEIIELLGGEYFFCAPILVGGKAIGLFYSDRIPSSRELDQQSFENFQFFAQQASLGLEQINRFGGKR